jgi:biopolymer transport protein ExbB
MGNAQAMASGIKEAMITTQAGLLVAIPGLLAGQIMRRRVRAIHQDVLIFQRAVTQWLEKEWRKCTE